MTPKGADGGAIFDPEPPEADCGMAAAPPEARIPRIAARMNPPDPDPGRPDRQRGRRRGTDPGEAWNVVGTLVSGLAFWGLVGFAVDHLTGVGTVFFPIGLAVGMAAALYLIIYRAMR